MYCIGYVNLVGIIIYNKLLVCKYGKTLLIKVQFQYNIKRRRDVRIKTGFKTFTIICTKPEL